MAEINMIEISKVKPYKDNPKMHTSTQVRKIQASIEAYGWDQPIVVDEEMVIIKGHGRYMAAQNLGLTEIPVLISDMSFEQARQARIADNKSAESEWDLDVLWGEISSLQSQGFTSESLGFSDKTLAGLFPESDMAKARLESKQEEKDNRETPRTMDGERDATAPRKETMIKPFEGELAFLRKLTMVDYLNWHDKIVISFSSGKDSMAAMSWICNNCDKSKIVAIYTNPTWGVDWPHSITYIPIWEKMFGVKVWLCGTSDPTAERGWEQNLMQIGFPGMQKGCWIESHIKIPQINAMITQLGLGPESGLKIVQIIGIRWEEGTNRQEIYPDRGIIKDRGTHYASPILQWLGEDVALYLDGQNVKLHTAYMTEPRMGCLICPKSSACGNIAIRKRFPNHWKKGLEWMAMGMRTKKHMPSNLLKWLSDVEDINNHDRFSPEFSAMAMSTQELEAEIEQITGKPLPKPYLTECYRPEFVTRNDLKKPWWEIIGKEANNEPLDL